jgi:transcriptional regulator with XRE-family HTH domain
MADWRRDEETVGELISRARLRLGKSQYALADALQEASQRSDGAPDRGMVARWETGRRIPTPYWRAHLATVLQLPAAQLDKAASVARARRRDGSESAESPSSDDRLSHVLEHPGSVDLASVGYLRERVRRLDEQYDRAPSTALIPEAGQYLGQIAFLGTHARRSYVRRELRAAEAEAGTLMGQLVWDASQRRDHGTAVAYFDQAVQAAQERGDKTAEGLALLRKSFVALYGWRDPKAGLTLTQRTADTTSGASHVLTGLAVLHLAESHAMIGNRRDCEMALARARNELTRIQPSDPAIDLFSPSQLGRLTGSCCLFLQDAKSAADVLEATALELQDQSKSQAVVLGNLALAYIRLGMLDAAVAKLNLAIDVTERNRGGGGMNIICTAGRQLRQWRNSVEVQDVCDRIMTLMAA